MKNINDSNKVIISLFFVFILLMFMIGFTFSLFTYTKIGTTDNTLTTGSLKFLYIENNSGGTGINITNALPVSDIIGKNYDASNQVFDFKIEASNSGNVVIPYEITLRKKASSTLEEKYVKVYLTDMTENNDSMLVGPIIYSDLDDTEYVNRDDIVEKTLYSKVVLPNQNDYVRKFRLRMWISDEEEFNGEEMNEKSFTGTVNVYANTNVISSEIENFRSNTEINNIYVSGAMVTQVPNGNVNYTISLENDVTSTSIMIDTLNPNSTVEIVRLDSLAYNDSNFINKLSTTKTVDLINDDNYFKITVTSENKEHTQDYILNIKK